MKNFTPVLTLRTTRPPVLSSVSGIKMVGAARGLGLLAGGGGGGSLAGSGGFRAAGEAAEEAAEEASVASLGSSRARWAWFAARAAVMAL